MDAFGGYFVDEKAVLVENIFLNFLKVMMVTIRFELYLKNACKRFVMELSSTFISDDNSNKIKRANNSRNWETGVSTGVVTCTSEVRAELLQGAFRCLECGGVVKNGEQQFKYTEYAMLLSVTYSECQAGGLLSRVDRRTSGVSDSICSCSSCSGTASEEDTGKNEMGIASAREQICRPQSVRMQETSKEIPAGSLPRSLNVILRHDIVEQARAGDMQDILFRSFSQALWCQRAPSTGSERPLLLPCIYSQFSAGSSTAGLIPDVWPMLVKLDEVQRMRNAPDLFNKLVDSISPTVFGHQDIKRALLLMLFGGVHNFTHEGVNLREDIDACIVGDPSCAKSQSLKYTSGIVPRSVYTSGKSSSAAGLTATVAKEPETAEFCIEVAFAYCYSFVG
ncbi:hypothetical protein POTOM_014192 [Populus tomentosa]|uniref:MCM C-terminal AAA(+) ATPase domain-containing protein n=1 Tax=Populus tomentosa TaxID=118781 RepID=A0A8X8A246_POPTO|nr:hypothetical protein POTOM_014192 [Populus tomentosa]